MGPEVVSLMTATLRAHPVLGGGGSGETRVSPRGKRGVSVHAQGPCSEILPFPPPPWAGRAVIRASETSRWGVCVCVCVCAVPSCSVVSYSLQPKDCSPPGSSVHGILQARILEWVAMPSSRGSSQPRNRIQVSCIAGRFFTT